MLPAAAFYDVGFPQAARRSAFSKPKDLLFGSFLCAEGIVRHFLYGTCQMVSA